MSATEGRGFLAWSADQPLGAEQNSATREEGFRRLVGAIRSGEITTIDSVESPLSRRIIAHHGATQFEMNSNWIETAQSWLCPCCARSKFDVSRLGSKGQILAKLVAHHDHMGEALRHAFNRAFEKAGTELAQVHGVLLIGHMAKAFAAHPPVLVCEDCNNADTKALRQIGRPPYFTFSIGQIRSFVESAAHRPHRLASAQVESAWEGASQAYALRMQLIEKVAWAAATDAHWYEPIPIATPPIPTIGRRHDWCDPVIQRWLIGEKLLTELGSGGALSVPNLSRWRTDPLHKGGDTLPGNYLALLFSTEGAKCRWESVSDGWHCPICSRSKEANVEIGDGGSVKFHLKSTKGNGSWQQAPFICNCCNSMLMSLKLEASNRAGYTPKNSYGFVFPEELARIVDARNGRTHKVIPERAAELVCVVGERIQEMAAQQAEW